MIDRDSIRKCLVQVIDSLGIDLHDEDILGAFDQDPEIKDLPTFYSFIEQSAQQSPETDWSAVQCMFDLFFSDTVSQLPRQTLPPLEITLSKAGHSLSLGGTRIGGEPEWTQCPQPHEENPLCSDCNEIMAFVCQIDSLGSLQQEADVNDFQFAFGGSLYLFACLKCPSTFSTFQCS